MVVFDGTDRTAESSYKLYLDGIEESLVTSGPFASVPLVNHISTSIASNVPFNGLIDDVYIYNRAFSASEVEALYNSY